MTNKQKQEKVVETHSEKEIKESKNHSKSKNGGQFDFDVEVGKILNLMINSLYANKDVALRELISNASDACDKMRYLATQDSNLLNDELKISISVNKKDKQLIIYDNGVGMNYNELVQNLGTIARSGTESFLKSLTGDKKKDVQLIGQFGVGFYSSFMIAKEVEVISRKYNEDKAWKWKSEGSAKFEILPLNENFDRGTKIILHLKDDASDFLDRFHIKHVVQTYSDHINFKIEFISDSEDSSEKKPAENIVLNSASALWVKSKEKITPEEYQAFYKHISHLPGDPLMTLHNKAEGVVSYTNLLFIPSMKPFDLFHPDRKSSVKLYVKRVFISEDLNLVPSYMRFLRGIVDTDDLALNISRETLQHSAVLEKIKKSVIGKVLSELKKKAENSPEEYLKFWNNFGAVLKEGICESSDFREKILELCRFNSSQFEEKFTSLDDYLSRMKPGQDKIYFLTGESIEKIKSSPQLEIFLQKNVEVLFLTDSVDEFWVTVALLYKKKDFQSINRCDDDLENLGKEKKEDENNDEKNQSQDSKIKDVTTSQFESLTKFMNDVLGEKVQEVRISKKLTNSPVCLGVDSKSMDIRLERFLVEQKQINSSTAKIFEINPNNQIIKNLNRDHIDETKQEAVRDTILSLFDLACIIEDEPVKDTKDFSRRIQNLMNFNQI